MNTARKAAILEKMASVLRVMSATGKKLGKLPKKPPPTKPVETKEGFQDLLKKKLKDGDYNRVKVGLLD